MSDNYLTKNGYYLKSVNYDDTYLKKLKKDLTINITNKYNKSVISYKLYTEEDSYIIVPKFYALKYLDKQYNDNIEIGKNIDIQFNKELWDIQKNIVDKTIDYIDKYNGGVLCLPCAAGKTVISLYLICKYKVKTLIIVHKSFLLNQWKERCEEFTNAKIGYIKQNIIDIENKDIVIGMLQSISKGKYDTNIFKDFGMVVFDEAHHAPSKYFSKALPIISCKITLGLSATPKRTDGMEKILYWYFGDIIYKQDIVTNNDITINIIRYDIKHPNFKEIKMTNNEINRSKMINNLAIIKNRNIMITELIINIISDPKRKIIILSDRINHLELIKNRFDALNLTTSGFYIGGMKQTELKNSEDAQIIFASYAMASEGLDIKGLNTLIMITPRSQVEQSVGRIMRKIDYITKPVVYDIIDMLPVFINQGSARIKFYNKMGFTIVDNNKEIPIDF